MVPVTDNPGGVGISAKGTHKHVFSEEWYGGGRGGPVTGLLPHKGPGQPRGPVLTSWALGRGTFNLVKRFSSQASAPER